ncbi:DUF5105 domain-containing protein [Weissella diestrammenae]|uniref:DUF5105 domain-containing protein n=1 Tax=Weissella diestrammenae TaxID=1162633 RepID=A0A7G9T5G6_9LACO|nr:DUF5105 domain-containing protein [Weissella diestrammenae]MCM0583202.1 DUF5105 domain-containing protein [Weissella diestrammenae]QNN75341.1 DUF5105 domain-containing protein [Weissella diestrammenae]
MKKSYLYGGIIGGIAVVVLGGFGIASLTGGSVGGPLDAKVTAANAVIINDIDESKRYVELDVKVNNKTSQSIKFDSKAFKLKNTKTNETTDMESSIVSDSIKVMSYGASVSPKSSAKEIVVFDLGKQSSLKNYELLIDSRDSNYKDQKQVEVKLSDVKLKDTTDKPAKALGAYISTIFEGKEALMYDKFVANDKSDDQKEFNKDAIAWMESNMFSNRSLEADAGNKLVQKLQAKNDKEAKVEYKVIEATPTTAEIEVTPTTASLQDSSDMIYDIIDAAIDSDSTSDMSYDQIETGAMNLFVDKFDDVLKEVKMKKDSYPEKIKLTNVDGKWKIDTTTDAYKSLSKKFMGSDY